MCVDYPLSMLKNCIMKIRITFNGNDVIAFPFVLLPALTREELEDIFSLIDTKIINDFAQKAILANMLKLLFCF